MKQPKKPPVKAKGRKGWGGRKKGIAPHHPVSHHKGGKQGAGGGGSGKPPGWKSGHKGIVPHHPVSHHHPRKKRQLSPGSDVACCSAQAVGTLLGWDWDQVLGLYWCTASDPDAGASIVETLQAAQQFSLSGRCPQLVAELAGVLVEADEVAWSPSDESAAWACPAADGTLAIPAKSHGLILGTTLPEPHAIAVTLDGTWWSWGEPFNPSGWPDLIIEEAWHLCAG